MVTQMSRLHKRGPPRHLEKMLFVNHKEDRLLDGRLQGLTLESRLKVMEIERERTKVRNELRNSKKRQITLNEAISSGRFGEFEAASCSLSVIQKPSIISEVSALSRRPSISIDTRTNVRLSTSAPPRRNSMTPQNSGMMRSTTVLQTSTHAIANQFSKQATIYESGEEHDIVKQKRGLRRDSVGAYVLGEFDKISQVVPDILRTLAKKKEQQQEKDELIRLKEVKDDDLEIDLMEYEPDMNKVRKTVSSVKILRHRMAISKKLQDSKPHKTLDQMIREKAENISEHDEFTDGTCALMKRRLEKKKRETEPGVVYGKSMPRRQSLESNNAEVMSRRMSLPPEHIAFHIFPLNSQVTRSSTTLGFGSVGRLNATQVDSQDESSFIDEDVLLKRQRIMKEFHNYQMLQEKVNSFLLPNIEGNNSI